MSWADGSEMTVVESNDDFGPQAFRHGNHRRIRTPERKIRVLLDKLGDARPILSDGSLYVETLEPSQKPGLCGRPPTALDQVGGLSDAEGGDHEAETRCP